MSAELRQHAGVEGGVGREPSASAGTIATVVIGRDLGERLRRSLASVTGAGVPVVYVDSGSQDGSPTTARAMHVEAIELDPSRPFTAARGRNEGFARVGERGAANYVMFVDGDVEIAPGWLERAAAELDANPRLGVVTGVLRERDRERNTYARLCDMDWAGPTGEIRACGGIFMARASAFAQVGGFSAAIATGEEAELCERLRRAGWTIRRIDAPMGEHDAGMTRFGQWWGRAVRVGHGYVKAVSRAGESKDPSKVRRILSNVFWAGIVPVCFVACLAAAAWTVWGLVGVAVIVLAYGALWLRIHDAARRSGQNPADARLYATFCLIAKWAHLTGHLKAWTGS